MLVLTGALFVGSALTIGIQARAGRARTIGGSMVVLAIGLALLRLLGTDSRLPACRHPYAVTQRWYRARRPGLGCDGGVGASSTGIVVTIP